MFSRIKVFFFSVLILFVLAGTMYYIDEACKTSIIASSKSTYATKAVIIIDAGHGGVDGGAVASDGTSEAELNLAIALKLNEMLKSFGIKTLMIRTGDYSVHSEKADTIREKKVSDIHNRMAILDNTDNAILVSVHQNFFGDSSLTGTQVFYSGNTPESKDLAMLIQNSVKLQLQTSNKREIKKSGTSIYLLYHAKKPAILVECGFLSNFDENSKLKSEDYQIQMAFSITCGILEYLSTKDV